MIRRHALGLLLSDTKAWFHMSMVRMRRFPKGHLSCPNEEPTFGLDFYMSSDGFAKRRIER